MCRNSCNFGLAGYEGIHNVSVSIIDINLQRQFKVTTLRVQECVNEVVDKQTAVALLLDTSLV